MYSSHRRKIRTYLCWPANYPVSWSQYRAENRNLMNTGSTFRHGTVFPPKQCIHQKEARGIESPKNVFLSSVQNTNLPTRACKQPRLMYVSIKGWECKFEEIRVYLSPWHRVFTLAMFILKGSYGYGEPKNVFLSLVQKPHLSLRDSKLPRTM